MQFERGGLNDKNSHVCRLIGARKSSMTGIDDDYILDLFDHFNDEQVSARIRKSEKEEGSKVDEEKSKYDEDSNDKEASLSACGAGPLQEIAGSNFTG